MHAEPRTDRPEEDRHLERPRPHRGFWSVALCGAAVPIAMSAAAMGATLAGAERDVLITAWIAVAVVGTAAVISSAAVLGKLASPPPRPPSKDSLSKRPE